MDARGLTDQIVSILASSGWFERVNKHEPKNAPGRGVTASVWVQGVDPVKASGLASTTIRVEFNARLMIPMLSEPQDDIDENLLMTLDSVFNLFSGDFELGGNVNLRMIDLLGAHGTPLSARAGYLTQDRIAYRTFLVVIPLIINDNWTQVA
jgi:hypothetical protein